MENNMEFNPEIEEMKHQFQLLTEKVDKQNIITRQLVKEIAKRKIYEHKFFSQEIPYILFWIITIILIIEMNNENYPIWTYFSIIYIGITSIIIKILSYFAEKKYLEKIGFDVTKYIDDLKQNYQKDIYKQCVIILCYLLPTYIHMGYFIDFLISQGETLFGIQSWWFCIAFMIIVPIVIGSYLYKLIFKLSFRFLE